MLKELVEEFEKKFVAMIWKYDDYVGEQCDNDIVKELNTIEDDAWNAFINLKEAIKNV